jgi:hypothetical protein
MPALEYSTVQYIHSLGAITTTVSASLDTDPMASPGVCRLRTYEV